VKNSKAYEKAETSMTAHGDTAALVVENTQVNVLCFLFFDYFKSVEGTSTSIIRTSYIQN
jgi:hypothetical protein